MSEIEVKTEETTPELAPFEWAEKIVNDPASSQEDKDKAEAIFVREREIEDAMLDDLDAILDIEDDDEREKAFENWK